MIWGRRGLVCAFMGGMALYGYHHCFWRVKFRNSVFYLHLCSVISKNPAVGHCRCNFTYYNVALQWLNVRYCYLYHFSEIVPAESHAGEISWSVSRETSKYKFWMRRDITVGAMSLAYLDLNDYSGELDEYTHTHTKKAGKMHLAYFYRLRKTRFFCKAGLLVNVY